MQKKIDINGTKLTVEEYGSGKTTLILIHGGPGLPGYMESLGHLLQDQYQIVEYYQRSAELSPCEEPIKLEDHISDLWEIIKLYSNNDKPILVGHSWGAGLALLAGAKHTDGIAKIILLGCMDLNIAASEKFEQTIKERMSPENKREYENLTEKLAKTDSRKEQNAIWEKMLELLSPSYSFSKIPELSVVCYDYKGSKDVMSQVDDTFPNTFNQIRVPVVALHGDYDPIPYAEVESVLKEKVKDIEFILIEKNVGHFMWLEPHATQKVVQLIVESCRSEKE